VSEIKKDSYLEYLIHDSSKISVSM